ncbi:MAG: hypothetical protein GY869_10350 [Planctomycetes bacterium]|nr:hypothetical protein [Planctomycetota bacterium]
MDGMILTEAEEAGMKGRLLTGRIIWLALMAGQLLFLVVALYVRQQREEAMAEEMVVVLMAVGAAMVGGGILAAVGIRIMRVGFVGKADDFGLGCQRMFTMMIIGMALLEGACFFCIVQILIGQRMDVMLGLVGLALAGQLSYWPTRDGWVRVWVESREGRGLRE